MIWLLSSVSLANDTYIAAICWPCCRSITGSSDSGGSWPRILLTLAAIWVSASFGSWSRRM